MEVDKTKETTQKKKLKDSETYKVLKPKQKNHKKFIIGISVGIIIGIVVVGILNPEETLDALDSAYRIQQMMSRDLSNNVLHWTEAVKLQVHWNDSAIMEYFQYIQLPQWDPRTTSLLILETSRPGLKAKSQGKYQKFPVILVPGFITTHLEFWDGEDCGEHFFGTSIWGDLSMIRMMITNATCWIRHLNLNPETGMDPPGIKVRGAEGIHGLDYLFPTYWVWGKLIRNLGDIGYDPNNLYAATYDWRLAPQNLEIRDHYFSHLSKRIETMVIRNNKKVVVISHSLGSNVFYYFLKWTETNISPEWVDRHVESWINVGGALLGSFKGLSSLLSGEMKDSAEMESVRTYIADKLISPIERVNLFRTWSSIASLVPKGGNIVWGSEESAPDDLISNNGNSYKHSIVFPSINKNMTIDESLQFLWEIMSDDMGNVIQKNLQKWYSFGVSNDETGFPPQNQNHSKYWTNPLESPLPMAPNMKIYCLYGINKATERGYVYRDQNNDQSGAPPLPGLKYSMDTTRENYGVKLGEGDGTVPLISLGYMCVDGWKNSFYNPSGMEVYSREYYHNPTSVLIDPRGGIETADHVDIMGNHNMIDDIISILSQSGAVDSDVILSPIETIAKRITKNIEKTKVVKK